MFIFSFSIRNEGMRIVVFIGKDEYWDNVIPAVNAEKIKYMVMSRDQNAG